MVNIAIPIISETTTTGGIRPVRGSTMDGSAFGVAGVITKRRRLERYYTDLSGILKVFRWRRRYTDELDLTRMLFSEVRMCHR
jgi:hypothetical protein